jgi:hypothetical protein
VRYDAIKAKPGSNQEKEKEELRKELDKAGSDCLTEMQRVYNHSEVRSRYSCSPYVSRLVLFVR